MIMQDVKYLASTELYVRDRGTGVLVEKAANFRGGSLALPDDLLHGGRCRAERPGHRLEHDFDFDANDEGTIALRIDCDADEKGPAIHADLRLTSAGAAPALSCSGRLTRAHRLLHVQAAFPVSGTITAADGRVFPLANVPGVLETMRTRF